MGLKWDFPEVSVGLIKCSPPPNLCNVLRCCHLDHAAYVRVTCSVCGRRHAVVAAARPYLDRKLRFGKASAFWRAMCRWLSAEDDPEELLELSARPTWFRSSRARRIERQPHAGRRASTNGRTILVRIAGLPLQGALRPEGVHAHALVRVRGWARAPARSHLLTLSHCAALCLHMHARACNHANAHAHARTQMRQRRAHCGADGQILHVAGARPVLGC